MVFEVFMFHEDTELLPFGESYDLFIGNNDPTERITLALFRITVRNKLGWVEEAKEDQEWVTNASSLFCVAFEMLDIANFFRA